MDVKVDVDNSMLPLNCL